MASTYSSLLRIELIGTGDQSGTWGDTTNTNLGTVIEQAIAATATVNVTGGNVTLTELNGSSDQSRCAALLITGTPGVTRNVVAPALSKLYVVSNTANASVVLKTSSSTGLTIPSGVTQFAYYNGTDFIAASQAYDADLSAIAGVASNGLLTRTGSGAYAARTITASTGITVTNGDGVSANPTIAVSTVPVANGGTGQTSYTNGQLLIGNTTGNTLTKATLTAGSGVNITNGNGSITISAAGTVTSVAVSGGTTGLTTSGGPITGSGTITIAGTLTAANGGTGVSSLTGLAYGNGTSAFTAASAAQVVAAIGSTAVTNATNATNATKLATTNFTIEQSGSNLLIKYGATTIITITSTGAITASGDVTVS